MILKFKSLHIGVMSDMCNFKRVILPQDVVYILDIAKISGDEFKKYLTPGQLGDIKKIFIALML